VIRNNLCNEEGVQLPAKYFALSVVAQLPDKQALFRFNNILKYGVDTAEELPKDTAGLLGKNDLLLHGGAFSGFLWQTAKTKLYGINVERGAMQTLTISVEMATMICDLVLPMLRTAGFPMSEPVVMRDSCESIIDTWTCHGYIIDDGSNQYADPGQNTLCIVADDKTVMCTLNSVFMREIGHHLGYERRQCYLAAEVQHPLLGWMLKSENTDPNAVMPFFTKWGVRITWAKRPPGLTDLPSESCCRYSRFFRSFHVMLCDSSACIEQL